jgi:hypothetical protein
MRVTSEHASLLDDDHRQISQKVAEQSLDKAKQQHTGFSEVLW